MQMLALFTDIPAPTAADFRREALEAFARWHVALIHNGITPSPENAAHAEAEREEARRLHLAAAAAEWREGR